MDVKEAVNRAKLYIADLYSDEEISDIGLEEVKFDEESDAWNVTVGFTRPWDRLGTPSITLGQTQLLRSYKVLLLENESGDVEWVKDRILIEAVDTLTLLPL